MLLLPAIDLRGGQCVRLRQGDYTQETVFDADPAAVASRFAAAGARYLHLVDLDGAREGRPVNGESVRRIVAASGLPCQLGGGLRTDADVEEALGWGVARVILGTRALQAPAWCEALARRHPGRVAIGIDARDGRVAVAGWLEQSSVTVLDLARRVAEWPVAALIYTDIARDGLLQGPNVESTVALSRAVGIPVVASGGVTTLEDVTTLARAGLYGCIIGRALYEGRIDLAAALEVAGKEVG